MAPSGGPQAIDMQPSAEAVPIRPVMAEPIEVHMLGLGVVGIVRDQHAAKLAKRVLFLSQVLVGIQLVLAVVAIVRNHGILFVLVGLFFNLIHPTCGYFGVGQPCHRTVTGARMAWEGTDAVVDAAARTLPARIEAGRAGATKTPTPPPGATSVAIRAILPGHHP